MSGALQTRDFVKAIPLMFHIVTARHTLEVLQANAITITSKGMISFRIVHTDVYSRHVKDKNNLDGRGKSPAKT